MSEEQKPRQKLRIAAEDSTATPDPYEARYMGGPGGVLHRERIRAPLAYHALILAPLLIVLVSSIATGQLLPLAITLPLILLLWVLFAVLRITVSRDQVHIQYGVFGPRIPVASIEEARAIDYDWSRFGGWGIRRGRDGAWAYNMMGDAGRAVQIVWRDERGSRHTHLVSSPEPERLAASIQAARAQQSHKIPARIASSSPVADTEALEAAAEAEAEAEAEANGPRARR
jgi:hypothetical protein